MRLQQGLTSVAVAAMGAWASAPSLASSVLNLTSTVTNTGGSTTATENYVVGLTGLSAPTLSVPPSQTFTIGDTFNEGTSVSTANDLGASATGTGGPWNFQDNYSFTTSTASIKSTTIAFGSDVSDLQARIISATGVSDTTNTNAAGQQLVGGAVTVINGGWTPTQVSDPVDFTVLMSTPVSIGSYILQIRGEAGQPGSYSGTVTFNTVPLPAALPLLLSGLGLLGGAASRRARRAV